MSWYSPTNQLTEADRSKGLKYLYYDGLCSHAMAILVTGAFLPGMALALGAGNFVIGVLASLAPISQMAQIPAILLVEKVGLRKLVTVLCSSASRLSLVAAAFVPYLAPDGLKVALFFTFMLLFFLAVRLRAAHGTPGSRISCRKRSWGAILPRVWPPRRRSVPPSAWSPASASMA